MTATVASKILIFCCLPFCNLFPLSMDRTFDSLTINTQWLVGVCPYIKIPLQAGSFCSLAALVNFDEPNSQESHNHKE